MTVEELLAQLKGVRRNGAGWTALCPGHADEHPSLSITVRDSKILLHDFGGCTTEQVLAPLGKSLADLFLTTSGLTVAELARAKKLPEQLLRDLGIADIRRGGTSCVRVPYRNDRGEVVAVRLRLALTGPDRFRWRSGDKIVAPYGVDRLPAAREAGWCLVLEGESDCWAAWHRGIPAIGVPGKATWQPAWAEPLRGLTVFLWVEPDADDLALKVAADLPDLKLLYAPDGIKDLSEAHVAGHDVAALLEELKAKAVPATSLRQEQETARADALRKQAGSVLAAQDPLALVEKEVTRLGYGGDVRPVLLTYVASTSRLLRMRRGSMLAHVLLLGDPGVGKNYTAEIALDLHPPEASHKVTAGSPRAVIYSDADLRHKVLFFGEADSIPKGEESSAASAIRSLLQDGELAYDVVVKNPKTNKYGTHAVRKPGPTLLVTTATKRFEPQMDTRAFALEIPDDQQQIRAALLAQAGLEEGRETPTPDPALVAFQALLQAQAPWSVHVPFARALSEQISKSLLAPRISRDYNRLLALVKAVAILRHQRRERDERGAVIATLVDYGTVRELVGGMYEVTVTEAGEKVRTVVAAVRELSAARGGQTVSQKEVAEHLEQPKQSVSRHIKAALRHGWILHEGKPTERPYRLRAGEELPDRCALPRPEELVGADPAADEPPFDMGDAPPGWWEPGADG